MVELYKNKLVDLFLPMYKSEENKQSSKPRSLKIMEDKGRTFVKN